ncbi:glycoside hydrolase family 71 protein [Lepidopterella palustris CBS 459.81]|uniref:Glycoside hydrolase family 71 protein n=1 Tax=Lepidopterella palustris CBS 459.81 TaxID=1314670 RepID=A0A8E2E9Z7_9PEZI|nr:glycoside hydrolase family 71 protein [Lepidopterella palustris CBS 459.81]
MNFITSSWALVWLFCASLTVAAPAFDRALLQRSSYGSDRLVFCHFMVGIVADRTSAADYDADMKRAKSYGIDAFALNIGTDSYTDTQLGYAYESANNNGMKVFISFDFNWFSPGSDASTVGAKIAKFASNPAQLMVDGKAFVSSFAGDALDVATMRSAAGVGVFFAPNYHPQLGTSANDIDAALNWMGWDNDGNNKAPSAGNNVTVQAGDAIYTKWLGSKPYIAPVSPWFSTHYGPEVSYSKNWVFPGDLLWYRRWNDILTLGPRFLEIITWNDYGESHYIGPLSSKHGDDGNSKWTNDMPHDGWLDMAKPFIAAYKAGASSPNSYITSDQLVYWYRPTLKTLDCDATDTTMVSANNPSGNYFEGRPNGADSMEDSVFVVALLTSAGKITVTSGSNSQSFDAPAGASAYEVPMAVGSQKFTLTRNGATVFSDTSLRDVSDVCPCGIYNFNAYVGTVPASLSDPMGAEGLASLTVGLHVSTCSAVPSLGTASNYGSTLAAPATSTTASSTAASSATANYATSTPALYAASTAAMTKVGRPTAYSKSAVGGYAPMATQVSFVTSVTYATPTLAGAGTDGCTKTITASSQIFPTNCLQSGELWRGPAGDATPDCCDPVKLCCREM